METQTSFKHYARAVRKRWWLLALLAIIAVSGVYFRFGTAAPGYVSSATVMVTSSPFTSPTAGIAGGGGRAREFVVQQLAEVRQRLDASDRALIAVRQNPANLDGAASSIIGSYYSGLTAVDDARTALREVAGRLNAAAARLGREAPTLVSETTLLDNPVYRQVEARLTDLEIERAQLTSVFTPNHPRMRQLGGEIGGPQARP